MTYGQMYKRIFGQTINRVSALTGKRMKKDKGSARKKRHLFWNHSFNFDSLSTLASNKNDFKVTLMESRIYSKHFLGPFQGKNS